MDCKYSLVVGVRVLYVDDAVDALEAVGLLLEQLGAQVETASSVDVALAKVESFAPAVIVTDLAMPLRDGFRLIQAVRSLAPPFAGIPVIALTAYARAEDAERSKRAGFSAHLAKPVDIGRLAATIVSALASGPP